MALAVEADWPGQVRQLRAAVCVLAQWLVARAAGEGHSLRRVRIEYVHLLQHLREREEVFGAAPTGAAFARGHVAGGGPPPQKADARRLSIAQLRAILDECQGNRSEAARRLGIARNTLARKIREFGIDT